MSQTKKDRYELAAKELKVRCLWGEPILPGDMYLAGRNTPISIYTCKDVMLTSEGEGDWIVPYGIAYPYDCHECVKVEEW